MAIASIAARTLPSMSREEARRRVLNLYREWLREVPRICDMYPLDLPIAVVRARIRREFDKYRQVGSLPLIDMLIFKGSQEFIETSQKWKQKTHVMKYFDDEERDILREAERLGMRLPSNEHNLHVLGREGSQGTDQDKTASHPDRETSRSISPFLHGFLRAGGVQ